MKNNTNEETNYGKQNSSKQKFINRTGTNILERNQFNLQRAQNSNIKENKLTSDSNNVKENDKNVGEVIPCHNKLNRNMGEHFLFKNVEYSKSMKGFCFNSNSGMKSINEEENVEMSSVNDKHYDRNIKLIKEDFNKKTSNKNIPHVLTSNVKLYEDKTTYCRPVLNYYNQQFIYKTMERNAKLKNLVRKLSIARQREKEKVNWNNFINELKNKHRYGNDDVFVEEYVTPDIINDGYNTTCSWENSKLCRNILNDFYSAYNTIQPIRIHEPQQEPSENIKYLPYDTNSYCYPTSSMGRLMMLRRNPGNNYVCKSENTEKIYNSKGKVDALVNKSLVSNRHDYKHTNLKNFKSSLVQVDNKVIPPIIENIKKDRATNNSEVVFRHTSNQTNKVDYLHNTILQNTNNSSLVNIENKLQYLIESINSVMVQIKSHKTSDREIKRKTIPYKTDEKINKNLNMTKSESLARREKQNKVLGEITSNSSRSTLTVAYGLPNDIDNAKINEFLKEVNTYNEVDFQNQYKNKSNKPCSLQISIEIPTKDCSTEVTKSLSNQRSGDKNVAIEEIMTPERPQIQEKMLPLQQMTIAVNTDPLSFLALLKFSTETLKRLMSYMPNFDYLSYLSALKFLQIPRIAETNYICKICGRVFDNPTKLSDHIHEHHLGKTRDCCVCRHVLEHARTSLFSCQYCGQHFTRSYCCELHQQTCAKRFGKCHNAASSLMVLR